MSDPSCGRGGAPLGDQGRVHQDRPPAGRLQQQLRGGQRQGGEQAQRQAGDSLS